MRDRSQSIQNRPFVKFTRFCKIQPFLYFLGFFQTNILPGPLGVVLLATCGLLVGCAPKPHYAIPQNCNYGDLDSSREIGFAEKDLSLQEFGYRGVFTNINCIADCAAGYKDFSGKKGKIVGIVTDKNGISDYFHIITEDCVSLYAHTSMSDTTLQFTGTYFLKDYAQASELVGKAIYSNLNNSWYDTKVLLTEDPIQNIPLNHLDTLTVLAVKTKLFGHAKGHSPFFLVVKKNDGTTGLLGYKKENFYLSDPIKTSWPLETIELIKAKKIRLGMDQEQSLVSWGDPSKINRTVTVDGTSEQYVYGRHQYLYFTNGILTAIQD